jgi:hypothetical protein
LFFQLILFVLVCFLFYDGLKGDCRIVGVNLYPTTRAILNAVIMQSTSVNIYQYIERKTRGVAVIQFSLFLSYTHLLTTSAYRAKTPCLGKRKKGKNKKKQLKYNQNTPKRTNTNKIQQRINHNDVCMSAFLLRCMYGRSMCAWWAALIRYF